MDALKKKILVIDEAGFSRICSAILEKEGYRTSALTDTLQFESAGNLDDYGLVIMSYPHGASIFERITEKGIPTIVLSDCLNRDLLVKLENFKKSISCCMIKPIDYTKFRALVDKMMNKSEVDGPGAATS